MNDHADAHERPTTGLRIVLEREDRPDAATGRAALQYVGAILSPAETLQVVALVADDGSVTVDLGATEPGDLAPSRRAALAEKVRLLVRTLVRQASSDELSPPRRINRWRDA
jgi:hypothetical protein